ncbi:MAG TPA: carbohydrate kinase [Caldilineae bacterium]|nr:carbohydrate kinase [Caldilineae bacterium]
MSYDVVFIGHFAKDKIVVGSQVQISSGGSVYYGAIALARLGYKVAIVTRLHPDDFPRLDEVREAGVEVYATPAPATSGIENTYITPDMDRRICRPLGFAGPFQIDEIPDVDAKVWLVGPIIAGEVSLELLERLAGRGTLALDVQGFVRVPRGDDLISIDWPEKERGLALVDVLKLDQAEAEVLTGQEDPREALVELARYGPRELLLTRAEGVLLYADGAFYEAPFRPRSLEGRTGRGDTCFATYLAKRLSAPPGEALRFAAAVTSLKMERPGPFQGTLADIEAYLADTSASQR